MNFNLVQNIKQHKKTWIGSAVVLALLLGGIGIHHHHVMNAQAEKPKVSIVHATHQFSPVSANNQLSQHSNHYIIPFKTPMHASSALVMDATNGHIVYNKHMREQRRVASLGKLMTLYLVQRKANAENAWNQKVHLSKNLVKLSYDTKDGLGGFKFKPHHTYTVRELYGAAAIDSSNNAAIALGNWEAGSSKAFVHLMNKQARIWHLSCHFVSISGLENDDLAKFHLNVGNKNEANHVSALNLAIITRHLLHDYPQYTQLSKQSQAKIDGQTLNNVNGLLKGKPWYDPKMNVLGLKSGFTNSAGYNFVAYAHPKGKHPIIAITLNDPQEFRDLKIVMENVYHHDKALDDNPIM